ncbi:MAG: hypothetical protein KBG28_19005 [Kofleriaceae bacterium]|jgi:hypothetical protein|nr:hypothetical protein [Kofleriaceae bacterium]MBP9206070.1 hypothetical protein [Kofleriaceae bacterium]
MNSASNRSVRLVASVHLTLIACAGPGSAPIDARADAAVDASLCGDAAGGCDAPPPQEIVFEWDKAVGRPPDGYFDLHVASAHKVGAYLVVNTDRWLATTDLEGGSPRLYANFLNWPLHLAATFAPDRIAGMQGQLMREYDLDDASQASWAFRGSWSDFDTVLPVLHPEGTALFISGAQKQLEMLNLAGELLGTTSVGSQVGFDIPIGFDGHFFVGSSQPIGASCITRVDLGDARTSAGAPTTSGCSLMRSADGFWAAVDQPSGTQTILRMDPEGNEIEPRLEGASIYTPTAVEWGEYVLQATHRGVIVKNQSAIQDGTFAFLAFSPDQYIGDEVFVVADGIDAWVIYKLVGPDEVHIQKLVYPPTFQPLRQ